jgi:O-antigen/teichoic acid export membrane protein
VKRLWYSPTLRSAFVLGVSGVGFAAANLILARVLSAAEYALFTLVVALVNLGGAIAPAGVDEIVKRHRLEIGSRLLWQVIGVATGAGLIFAGIAAVGYELSWPLVLLVLISTLAYGVMLVAGAQFQSELRFGISLSLLQSPNAVLLIAAAVVLLVREYDAWLPLLIASVGYVAAAAYGWGKLFAEQGRRSHERSGFSWPEALSFAGVNAAGLLLIQLERLVIPHVLPLQDLATYGVLAAIVGSLFRVFQMGVGYSLTPRLRAAATVQARRRLLAHEAKLAGGIVLLGSVFLWVVTPLVERYLLAGKYHLSASLILATIVSGLAKLMSAFTKSTVTAVADPREVHILTLLSWVSVGVAILAALAGGHWLGLAGVIYGVGLGWAIRAAAAYYLTMRHLRPPAPVPVPAP